MTIYLYVKTHNKTGLKYLGKTIKSDPHKYTGSGVRWLRHLRKHGFDYTTDIIRECQTENELIEWGLYYSTLWNIVESNDWANLKEEAGDGGRLSLSSIRKQLETKRKNNTLNSNTPESIAKRNKTIKSTGADARRAKNFSNSVKKTGTLKRAAIKQWETCWKTGVDNTKLWEVTSPEGQVEIIRNMAKFCREHGLANSAMTGVAKGICSQHKGWRCKIIEPSPTDEVTSHSSYN